MKQKLQWPLWAFLILLTILFVACGSDGQGDNGAAEQAAPTAVAAVVEATATTAPDNGGSAQPAEPPVLEEPPPTPDVSPTPELVASVNGQIIELSMYESELARYEQAQLNLGLPLEENYEERVFLTLLEQAIIDQTAAANNIVITDEMVQAKITEYIDIVGGQENFSAWLDANQITEEEFPQTLIQQMKTEQVVTLVTADVPFEVEQVRARYIEVADSALAQSIVDQARGGTDFASLAQAHSLDQETGPIGGDIGFFARGTLLVPELETAAFALELNGVSDVINVTRADGSTSFYIVQLIERDPARAWTPEQRWLVLQETFERWLAEQLAQAEIIRYID